MAIIRSMYMGLTARVKGEGDVSASSIVCGRAESTPLICTNRITTTVLQNSYPVVGKVIGPIYIGVLSNGGDDVLYLSEDDAELQLMFNLSYIKSQEKRYHIYP